MSRFAVSEQTQRICGILRAAPDGLPGLEVARQLGASADNIHSRLSKLAAYGVLQKIPARTGVNMGRCAVYKVNDAPERLAAGGSKTFVPHPP